jgi:drug/metabolite transporter (DMT)-like permease
LVLDHIGELAALGTSLCFSVSSLLFTFAGREVGSVLTNRARLFFALVFVAAMHALTFGQLLPLDAAPERWLWLGISGVIGFAFGDACLFQAFVLVGPRLSMLVMAFAPALSLILAWLFLGESLSAQDLLIVAIIIAGIAWVVAERPKSAADDRAAAPGGARQHLIGLLWALGGSVGQAVGVIFSKVGLAGDFPALSGTVIRLLSAFVVVWAITLARGAFGSSVRGLRAHPRAVRAIVLAAFIGPVVGVWLTLYSVQHAPVGIASTLSSLAPIFLLPISYLFFGERFSRRAVMGTVVVIAATALLFV